MLVLLAAFVLAFPARAAELDFRIDEGRLRNAFLRDGDVAAHVVLKSGKKGRIVVAFPAGNSGVGLWLGSEEAFGPIRKLRPRRERLADGAVRRGVSFETEVEAPAIVIERAILSSVRILRDYEYGNPIPADIETAPRRGKNALLWERRRLDGAPGYFLKVEALVGRLSPEGLGFTAHKGRLKLRVTALSGDEPLAGIPISEILNDPAIADERLSNVLAFLSYDEKFLAGSWRFNTYFGRDTLMTLALLADILRPRAMEAGLGAVISRLSAAGDVAHEEEIGEFAIVERMKRDEAPEDRMILDYKMIDDDFMLAPTLAAYLLDSAEGRSRASVFLARAAPDGRAYGAAAMENLRHVIKAARPFSEKPEKSRLLRIKHQTVGNWRDSDAGLGGGVCPYDVNVALAPAALRAAVRLGESDLLDAWGASDVDWREVQRMAQVWDEKAPGFFRIKIDAASARRQTTDYARAVAVDAPPPAAGVGDAFAALSLDETGSPVPVLHSDIGFRMFFGDPAPAELDEMVSSVFRPFPAGLLTPVGMLVANPAYAPETLRRDFGRDRYHGAVVWAWQQALAAAGLQRQLARDDLPEAVRRRAADAAKALDAILRATAARRAAELWSSSFEDGAYRDAAFGDRSSDDAESNAAQLWSAAALAGSRCQLQPQ